MVRLIVSTSRRLFASTVVVRLDLGGHLINRRMHLRRSTFCQRLLRRCPPLQDICEVRLLLEAVPETGELVLEANDSLVAFRVSGWCGFAIDIVNGEDQDETGDA